MTAFHLHSEPDVAQTEGSLKLGAVQIVDVVSGVVHDLDEFGQRIRIVMERAPTVIADSDKLAEVTASLLRSALDSAPSGGPIEVEVAARCLAQSHQTVASGGERQECQALVSVAIRDHGADAEHGSPTSTPNRTNEADLESALGNARNIVRLHKGRLWVTDTAEHGRRTLGFCLSSDQAA